MPSVDIIDLNNKVVGSIELSDAVFGAGSAQALPAQSSPASSAGGHAALNGVDQDAARSGRGRA